MKQYRSVTAVRKYLHTKIKWECPKELTGRLRFKSFGLQKQLNSPTLSKVNLIEFIDAMAPSLHAVINAAVDPDRSTLEVPYTGLQLHIIETDLGAEIHPKVKKAFFVELPTFAECYQDKFPPKMCKQNGKRQLKNHKATAQFAALKFFDTQMDEITGKQIVEAIKDLRTAKEIRRGKRTDKTLGRETVAGMHEAMRAVFAHAYATHVTRYNAFDRDKTAIQKYFWSQSAMGKKHFLDMRQCDFMHQGAKKIDAHYSKRTQAMWGHRDCFREIELFWMLGLFSGARFDDLTEVTWSEFENLDTDEATWTIVQRKHMGEEGNWGGQPEKYTIVHELSEDPELLAMIRAKRLRDPNSNVFFWSDEEGKKVNAESSIRARFQEVVEYANDLITHSGVNDKTSKKDGRGIVKQIVATPHMMRHTMVAYFVSLGAEHDSVETGWEIAAQKCGHASVDVTKAFYGNMLPEFLNKTRKTLQAAILQRRKEAAAINEKQTRHLKSV